jgi:hypothetical protein
MRDAFLCRRSKPICTRAKHPRFRCANYEDVSVGRKRRPPAGAGSVRRESDNEQDQKDRDAEKHRQPVAKTARDTDRSRDPNRRRGCQPRDLVCLCVAQDGAAADESDSRYDALQHAGESWRREARDRNHGQRRSSATSPRVRIPAPFPRMSRLTPMTMPAAVAASSLGAISINSAINSRSINRCTFGAGGAAPHLNSREHRSRAPCPSACGARYRESSEPGACFPSARLPRYAKAPTTIRSSA